MHMCAHTCVHTHIFIYTCVHSNTLWFIQNACTQICVYTCVTHIDRTKFICTCRHICTYISTYVFTYTCTCTDMHIHIYVHIYMHALHIYVHIYIYIHAYTYMYMYKSLRRKFKNSTDSFENVWYEVVLWVYFWTKTSNVSFLAHHKWPLYRNWWSIKPQS